jgi:hypothetical protein
MPRRARIAPGELVYYTLNRANGRSELFSKPEDYAAFERTMIAAMHRYPTRLLPGLDPCRPMPHHPRVHAEGLLYHVMARGNADPHSRVDNSRLT